MCFSTKTPKRRGGTLLQISVCGGYGALCPPLPRSGAYGEFFVQLQDVVHYVKLYEISVLRLCSHHIPESFSCRLKMRIRYTVNSNSTELEQVVYKHQPSCRSGWSRGFGELNPSPYSWISSSISLGSSPLSYLFTSATDTCSHRTKVGHRTYPIYDAPRSRSAGAASLHYRNSAKNQWQIQGRGPAPPIFRPNWGPKGRKKFSGDWALPVI